jgi:hypothetical protein
MCLCRIELLITLFKKSYNQWLCFQNECYIVDFISIDLFLKGCKVVGEKRLLFLFIADFMAETSMIKQLD